MHPSFEQFVSALRDPSQRASIGLSISDTDAAALLTRHEWAIDYYHQWLAMFPAVATATPAPVDYGPPPGAATPQFATSTTPIGRAARMPSGVARLLIIGGSAIGAVLLVVGGVSAYSAVMAASVSHHSVAVGSPTSTAAVPLPDDLHGLTAREYPLMESVFESEDRTIPEMSAQGMTDDRLRSLADTILPQADKACTDAAHLQNGFDNPTYKASFIAGYVTTSKVTPDKAAKVYDAIASHCRG